MKQIIKSSYAKVDPVHLFDGLFVPTNGINRKQRLYVPPRKFGDSEISFQGFELLGSDDQSVLLAITAQLGTGGLLIGSQPNKIASDLRSKLSLTYDEATPIATKKVSLRSLSIDAGYDPQRSTSTITASLNRLRNAQIREIDPTGADRTSNIISAEFNRKTKETYIAANPRITNAVFSGQHIRVSLFERNVLDTEVAKLLHCWLSSNIRLGNSLGRDGGGAMIDTLAPHVWGVNQEEQSAKVRCRRRGLLRDALDEIADKTMKLQGGYGWVIDQTKPGLVFVGRPKELPTLEHQHELMPSDVHLN